MNKKNQILAVFTVGLLAGPVVALADFNYEQIDPPGETTTQVFGINDRGDVVGNGIDVIGGPFVYDSKKGTYTLVTTATCCTDTSILGNDDAGNMVGSVDGDAFIRDKKGNYAAFFHPAQDTFTQARGVNNKGLVSGFRDRPDFGGTFVGFIYDPKNDAFTDLIPAAAHTIAHGINSKGAVVGNSFFFNADDPCPGSPDPLVEYAWLRAADGTVTYFNVNDSTTRARGINDSGKIAGFIFTDGPARGFVVELDGSQCQAVTVAASDLLENDLGFDDTIPEGISNSGIVVGNVGTGLSSHGFIARPR